MKNEKFLDAQAVCLLVILAGIATISVYQKTGWNIMFVVAPILLLLPFILCPNGWRKLDEEQNNEQGGTLEVYPSEPELPPVIEQDNESWGTLKVCHPKPINSADSAQHTIIVKSSKEDNVEQHNMISCLDRYEERQAELLQREAERRKEVIRVINEYVTDITAGYLSKKSLTTLLSNISLLACGETDAYQPLSSDMERKLKSPDLRHLAWNIGERLGVSRAERARFILACFPYELRNATQMYLEANLRDTVPSYIRIDVPDKDGFSFHHRTSDWA